MKRTFSAPIHMVDFADKPFRRESRREWAKAIRHALIAAPVVYAVIAITLTF